MSKNKISAEDKIKAVKLYLDGKKSQGYIASKYGVVKTSVQRWIMKYQSMGESAFYIRQNKKYSSELKEQAVYEYLEENCS